jgi:maltooligosyltrehalose trehalohydrolase
VPDPASRFQPEDVFGPSEVIDPRAYRWRVRDWKGRPWEEAVIYEVHIGTATPEGTFAAFEQHLPDLAALGVTAIELMPLADVPGARNWGYDGVLPYAPDAAYGTPDDLKRLVDRAHELGLMVRLGARPSIATASTPRPCATSSSATRSTGSTNSTSTA